MRKNYKTKTIMYKNVKLEVTSDGRIFQYGKELKQRILGRNIKQAYVDAYKSWGAYKPELVNVARAVCQAFHECENFENLQVDHIDCNTLNNNASNLRWATRKFNNSHQHALKLRSENAKSISIIAEQLERVKNLLEANLEEMKKVEEAEFAMRELCAYELEAIKK